jgi:signal transduction histidine kinase
MTLRFRMAAWFAASVGILLGALIFVIHRHLDEELREDRWDRSHPKFANWVIHCSYSDRELAGLVSHINQLLVRAHDSYAEMAEFSAKVAHELRNPLTHLPMKVEAATPRLDPAFSEEIQEAIHRLSQLVERSLFAAKAEGRRIEPALENCLLDPILDDMHEVYSVLAGEQDFSLEWRTHPGVVCTTDPGWLRQILHNLLGNALRHGKSKVRFRSRLSPARTAMIFTVSNDTAPPESRASGGAGIGLRLVNALVHQLPSAKFRISERRGAARRGYPSRVYRTPSTS